MDFSKNTYDWKNMSDTYDASSSEESKTAVAVLMRDCGYAVNMEYANESAATEYDQAKALINHFGYDKGLKLLRRDCYSYDEWHTILYNELANGRPMLTCGGVHAFLFDGYKQEKGQDLYHVNWGWGGDSDGYFLCSNLNPDNLGIGAGSGSFTQGFEAIVGIRKSIEGSSSRPELYFDSFTLSSAKVGGEAVFNNSLLNYSVIDSVFTLGLKVINGNDTTYVKDKKTITVSPFSGLETGFKMSLDDFPTTEGVTYEVYPIAYVNDQVYPIRVPNYQSSFMKAEVKDGEITFWNGENIEVPTISDIKIGSTKIYTKSKVKINAMVTAADNDYCAALSAVLVKDANDAIYDENNAVAVDLRKGEKVNAEFVTTAPQEAGTYHIVFITENGKVCESADSTIVVEAAPEGELAFEASITLDKTTGYDPAKDDLLVDFSVTCTSGYYQGKLYMVFIEQGQEDPSAPLLSLSKDELGMEKGDVYKGTGNIDAGTYKGYLEYGKTYDVAIAYMLDDEVAVVPSETTITTAQSSGISSVTTGSEPQTIKIYSLGGKLITTQTAVKPNLSTLPAGAYIVKIGDKAQKMVSGK